MMLVPITATPAAPVVQSIGHRKSLGRKFDHYV
jgi:hypothetical protein